MLTPVAASGRRARPTGQLSYTTNKIIVASIFFGHLFVSDLFLVNAFAPWSVQERVRSRSTSSALRLARKYLIIGGSGPFEEEDDQSLSKKER